MHVHNKMYKYGSVTAVRGFTPSACRSISDAEMQFGSALVFLLNLRNDQFYNLSIF